MDFDWDEFLDLAEELARRRGDVGAERSAISRAYYAAFHGASAFAVVRGERLTETGDDHLLVWAWFARPTSDHGLRWIGEASRRLRRARRRADYDATPVPGLSTEVRGYVGLARRILVTVARVR